MKKIAINGFGRIGRVATRLLFQSLAQEMGRTSKGSEPRWRSDLQLVAINDLTDAATLAHLLKYDSVHRRFGMPVEVDGDQQINIDGQNVRVTAEKDPSKLPWKEMGVDIVLECTGIFTGRDKAALHLQAGASNVIVSAPSPDPDITIAYGVNHQDYSSDKHKIISCASCTTNCLAPVAKVLLENFGIERGTMTTIHSYTNDQRILDLPHKDLRRARAAALSMIPTTTGAAKAVGLVLPDLKGKVDGFAVRVPTSNVSMVDFVAEVKGETTKDKVNQALKAAAQGPLSGILDFSEEPLVSIDYLGDTHSSIVDGLSTMVIGGKLVKVIAWYDNEVGFSSRMLDTAKMLG